MLEGRADIAVHSMKDVPVEFPEGLGLVTICERDDPRDAFVSNRYASIDELPAGSVVGTSSLRRQCQLAATRPDTAIRSLRGNVGTRLSKLDNGEYDAIILAAAGLKRLQLEARIRQPLSPEQSLPAVGGARSASNAVLMMHGPGAVSASQPYGNGGARARRAGDEHPPRRRLPGADRQLCGTEGRGTVAAGAGWRSGWFTAGARRTTRASGTSGSPRHLAGGRASG